MVARLRCKKVLRFSYGRSWVLDVVEKLPGGKVRIHTAFSGGVVLPRRAVRLTVFRGLRDSSFSVVDFGNRKRGRKPTVAIIAAGAKDRLPQL